jgi:hypothetical protein
MLDALADFCNYSGMEVDTKKCVSVSITWQGGKREDSYATFPMRKDRCPMDKRGMHHHLGLAAEEGLLAMYATSLRFSHRVARVRTVGPSLHFPSVRPTLFDKGMLDKSLMEEWSCFVSCHSD